jgi:hypothetical protein
MYVNRIYVRKEKNINKRIIILVLTLTFLTCFALTAFTLTAFTFTGAGARVVGLGAGVIGLGAGVGGGGAPSVGTKGQKGQKKGCVTGTGGKGARVVGLGAGVGAGVVVSGGEGGSVVPKSTSMHSPPSFSQFVIISKIQRN